MNIEYISLDFALPSNFSFENYEKIVGAVFEKLLNRISNQQDSLEKSQLEHFNATLYQNLSNFMKFEDSIKGYERIISESVYSLVFLNKKSKKNSKEADAI